MMLRGENGRAVVQSVKDKVREINENNILPSGIKIVPYYDRSDIVASSVGTVTKALLEGSILVVIVLFFMLRSLRGAAVVILALPLSLFLTFIVMKNVGLDANLMSLGGLAISIGMIIDATIIQVENVQRHLSEKGSLGTQARDGVEGSARGPQAQHLRRADHRHDLPSHPLPGRARRENVRPAGPDGCHRAAVVPGSVYLRHPGAVRAGAAARPRKGEPRHARRPGRSTGRFSPGP